MILNKLSYRPDLKAAWRSVAAASFVIVFAALPAASCGPKAATVSPAASAAEADAFLAKTAKEPGVKVLPSGLQYKIVSSGPDTGPHPGPRDEVKVDYVGSLPSGQVFDSSIDRGTPAVMSLSGLVPAWQEAIPLMRPGDGWIIYSPPSLGYGAEGAGGVIPPNSALVFKIKLLGVLPAGAARG